MTRTEKPGLLRGDVHDEPARPLPGPPFELKRRIHLLNVRYNRMLAWSMAGLLLLPLVIIAVLLGLIAGADTAEACRELLDKATKAALDEPLLWVALAALPPALIYLWLWHQRERLVVTDRGLEYRSAFRGALSFLHGLSPGWSLNWDEIDSVKLAENGARAQMLQWWRLIITPKSGRERAIAPYLWYRRPDENGLPLKALTRRDAERIQQAVEESPIYRVLDERGLIAAEIVEAPAIVQGYDMRNHKGLWVAVIGFFLLAGFAVVDTFFVSPWSYAEWPPVGPFLTAAIIAGVAGVLLGKGAPNVERFAVAGLLAAAAAGAAWPGLLRVNAATDPDGPSGYRFRQVSAGVYEAVDHPGMPRLRFDREIEMEFWRATDVGSKREFILARGRPGFWQLDLRPVHEAMREFFRQRADDEG